MAQFRIFIFVPRRNAKNSNPKKRIKMCRGHVLVHSVVMVAVPHTVALCWRLMVAVLS